MEKTGISSEKPQPTRRWVVISLGVYGFVVSLILVAAITGGALCLQRLKQDLSLCKETHNNVDTAALTTYTAEYKLEDRHSDVTQKVQLNMVMKTEVFIENGTVAVFDFLKNIGGFYTAEYNRCFLVGGLDEKIKTPENLKKELASMKLNQLVSPASGIIDYQASRVPVTDQSFFPEALAPFCKGRPTYWLTEYNKAKRVKRRFRIRISIRIRIRIRF